MHGLLVVLSGGRMFVLSLGVLLTFVSGYYVFVGHASPDAETAEAQGLAAQFKAEIPSTASVSELWEKLTRARISLEVSSKDSETEKEKADSSSEEDASTEETKDAAKQPRPDWVENPPKRMGNVYRRVVTSDLYSTVDECHLQLEQLLRDAVRERLQTLVADEAGPLTQVPDPSSLGIGLDTIMREICRDEFTETVSASFGEMKKVHVLMEFDPGVEKQLRLAWQEHERRDRLRMVGASSALALSLLAGLYGLLKFGTWTRGSSTKRLLLGVPAAIIGLVVLWLIVA